MKRSKKYKSALEKIDKQKEYSLSEAVDILPEIATSTFDASIELHIHLNLNEKQRKRGLKGSVTLPHQVKNGTTKILVLTTPEHEQEAKDADFVGGENYIKKIQDGWNEFDVVLATPEIMPKIAILGKVLGPKGLMPNPKSGTVTTNLSETIQQYKKGKIDFKSDEQGNIHQAIGKVSMAKEELMSNTLEFIKAVNKSIKSTQTNLFKSIHICPTMGPSVKIDPSSLEENLTTKQE